MEYCKCHGPISLRAGIKDTVDELVELVNEPSLDELSDVVYGINRTLGGLFGKTYLRVLPGDGMHVSKINGRMAAYGCVRSKRHLVDGKCPSL